MAVGAVYLIPVALSVRPGVVAEACRIIGAPVMRQARPKRIYPNCLGACNSCIAVYCLVVAVQTIVQRVDNRSVRCRVNRPIDGRDGLGLLELEHPPAGRAVRTPRLADRGTAGVIGRVMAIRAGHEALRSPSVNEIRL